MPKSGCAKRRGRVSKVGLRGRPPLSCDIVEKHIDELRALVKTQKTKRAPKAMPQGKLRVFADCAGISSETIALALLGMTSEHMEFVGGSEIDPVKRTCMQVVHKNFQMPTNKDLVEKDIFDRVLPQARGSDLYIAGFPCPAYSACGKKAGARDGQKRGLLIFEGLKHVAVWKPSLAIFENAVGFLHRRHRRTHQVMKTCFAALGYKVYMKKMFTQEHGVPHSRPRIYIVAFRSGKKIVSFRFPKARACPPLSSFLDVNVTGAEKLALPNYEKKYGAGFWKEDIVLDVGASSAWQSKTAPVRVSFEHVACKVATTCQSSSEDCCCPNVGGCKEYQRPCAMECSNACRNGSNTPARTWRNFR